MMINSKAEDTATHSWMAGSQCPAPAHPPLCSRRATGQRWECWSLGMNVCVGERVRGKGEG